MGDANSAGGAFALKHRRRPSRRGGVGSRRSSVGHPSRWSSWQVRRRRGSSRSVAQPPAARFADRRRGGVGSRRSSVGHPSRWSSWQVRRRRSAISRSPRLRALLTGRPLSFAARSRLERGVFVRRHHRLTRVKGLASGQERRAPSPGSPVFDFHGNGAQGFSRPDLPRAFRFPELARGPSLAKPYGTANKPPLLVHEARRPDIPT